MEGSIESLLEFIVHKLVGDVSKVKIERELSPDGEVTVYQVTVSESDMGRVIGKRGRIAKSIRSIVKAAAIKNNIRAEVKIG
ncbi:MAG: KH domain-containing protein [Acutalibacteraceae bacterium]